MKKLLPLVLLAAASLLGCAHSKPRSPAALSLRTLTLHFCMARAMAPMRLIEPGEKPADRREEAFRNYWEAVLDAKGQGEYVDCLAAQWRVPWLHSDYRRARRWLRTSQKEAAEYGPMAGPDLRVAGVSEEFENETSTVGVRRVTITLASGGRRLFQEEFPRQPKP